MKAHTKGDHMRVLEFPGSSRSQRNRRFVNLGKPEFTTVIRRSDTFSPVEPLAHHGQLLTYHFIDIRSSV